MSAVLIRIFQVILALSVLIAFHELGHYTFARIFGIRVDKFFLFFDIGGHKLLSTKEGWFSRLFPSLKKSETEYGIGWLPLGGYCKINGMIDESMDSSFTEHEPRPWEFRSKPAWQRLLVMLGGVLFNFIFAILMFVLILGIWGQSYLSNDENAIYTTEGELAYDMGFRTGDRILSLDDYVPENFGMLQADIARRSVHKATVLRGADTVEIYIDQARIPEILNTPGMFQVAVPFVVDTIPPSSPNYGAGILRGDRIVEVDGQHIDYVQDSRLVLGSRASTSVPAKIVRGGDTLATTIAVDSTGKALIYAHGSPPLFSDQRDSRGNQDDWVNDEGISPGPQDGRYAFYRGLQVGGQFRGDRGGVPGHVGLEHVPLHACSAVCHARNHESHPDSRA